MKKPIDLKKLPLIIFMIGILIVLAGCSSKEKQPDTNPSEQKNPVEQKPSEVTYSKEKIQEVLADKSGVFQITWSPDENKVVYIKEGQAENKGMDQAYIWKAGEQDSEFVRDVSPTTHGFSWSPNSQYFIISEKLGEGAVNSIVKVDTLKEEAYKIKSVSMPVWSPDSKALAYSYEHHDYGESWGSLEVYKLGDPEREYIWYAKDYFYKVESWDKEGNISYIERNPEGQEIKKSTPNIRPSISGVHLGDNMEQVRTALGKDYEETPPGEEIGHFPERVYRWTYDEGYKVFIGRDSGKVIEIIATSPKAETNLGVKVGDTAKKVFETYRPHYMEPESIHGGKLIGIFKVEGAAAMNFVFDYKGMYREDIKPDNKVEMIILTYPAVMDDSF